MISEIKMRKKSPPGDPVMRVLGHSILPHKSLKLSSLFKISFSLLVDWLSSTALSFKLTDYSSSSLLLVLLVPLVYFSVQLLYFFFFHLIWVLSYISHLFVEVLTVFIYSCLQLIWHLYDYYFESFSR